MNVDEELEKIKNRMMKQLIKGEDKGLWRDGEVVELNSVNFEEALNLASKPVLIDFWANWCAPCRFMKPVVESLAQEYSGKVHFAKVDVDQNQSLAARYGVLSIPNFVIYKNGKLVDHIVGAVGEQKLEAFLRKHLQNTNS